MGQFASMVALATAIVSIIVATVGLDIMEMIVVSVSSFISPYFLN